MDNSEARALLRIHLDAYRHRKYEELVMLLGKPQVVELRGASGATYQVEVEVHCDDRPGGAVRDLGSVDDGGWRSFKRLCDDHIVVSHGTLGGDEKRVPIFA